MKKEIDTKVGRPSIFSELIATKILSLFSEGRTEKQVAEIIGVHENTIRNWKKKDGALLWATNEAKLKADEMVEASTFHRAIGYSHPEEKLFYDSKTGKVVRDQTTRHYPPDTEAAKFWLKNRKPKEWKDRVEYDHTVAPRLVVGGIGGNAEQESLGTDDTPASKAVSGVQEPK